MTIELLDKSQLTLLNKRLRYPLAVAEKDYFLALVSKIIYESPLKDVLVFKGGTALHHTYLPQFRFSEDLDFSTNHRSLSLEDVKAVLKQYDFLSVKKEYISDATMKIERLAYVGPLGQSNSLKVEIDVLQNVVLPPVDMDYRNDYGVQTQVRVMDIREIAAEKIRSMNDRVRYRDFYDFGMIMRTSTLDLDAIIGLVRKKEVRKTISPQTVMSNWELARREKASELAAIYYSEELADEMIASHIAKLQFESILKT
ncbi:MAG: nucleotidyl transferase AbiEii/AbiGii toxin family protein [Candidatus Kerfeldbacteria bacterium]|nr:nucleotidyl transferase AbiEii/AbiGii toxin family protein [Candidatus Kerfeldbacteria bacterium]